MGSSPCCSSRAPTCGRTADQNDERLSFWLPHPGSSPSRISAASQPADRLRSPAHSRSSRPSHRHTLWWKESELPPNLDHLPPALVNEAMVVVAEQHLVGKVG